MTKKLILFLDCGDTIIDEGTEIRDQNGVVIKAEVIPGADHMVRTLVESGYRLALVADGMAQSFENMLKQHGLYDHFEVKIYSERIQARKPDRRMFDAAIRAMGLTTEDYSQIAMVGNNLSRDMKGANALGITSIFLNWTPRYTKIPRDASEQPDYTISQPMELLDLSEKLNQKLLHNERMS